MPVDFEAKTPLQAVVSPAWVEAHQDALLLAAAWAEARQAAPLALSNVDSVSVAPMNAWQVTPPDGSPQRHSTARRAHRRRPQNRPSGSTVTCIRTFVGGASKSTCQAQLPGKAGDKLCLGTSVTEPSGVTFPVGVGTSGAAPATGYICAESDGVSCDSTTLIDRFRRSMIGNVSDILDHDRVGVQVVSVRESWLDTGSPVRTLLLAIFSWLADEPEEN